ncbi:hypothetical protein CARUB_v10010928mg [Capsella rubella]|uniref:F-box domain-containing protein n=1 Tax=Capsella rubella TaxID=81985 RepID=R0GSI8_9BRAS|nr:putative F-box/FBD/LRR-repeat protein At3g49030 [Capsella rubella]EOA38751.1 hypothetical protein CARUB_v10010928mg [Capsella rubella]
MVNEDRISELSEDLLLKILSLLPTETVTSTSVLSKNWRSLWKMVPNLKFEPKSDQSKYYNPENIYKFLTLHKAPVLESLHLNFKYEADILNIGMCIETAFARRVRELVLVSLYEEDKKFSLYDEVKMVKFPSVLFNFNDTLEILEIHTCFLFHFPSRVFLKSLRKLFLNEVNFEDEESVCNLLGGCPSLEDLVVDGGNYCLEGPFTIAVPSLQRLTIYDNYPAADLGGYVINAPCLKYLKLERFCMLGCCLIENAPELVEAVVVEVYNITNENILESLTCVKRLSLEFSSSFDITFPTGKIFDQLVDLELTTYESDWLRHNGTEWWKRLLWMLDSAPKLRILKLTGMDDCERDLDKGEAWNPPECVPECLLFHLEKLLWKGFNWQQEDEEEVATYILENARRLKEAAFFVKRIDPKEVEKLEKSYELLDELAIADMASNSCKLVFGSI